MKRVLVIALGVFLVTTQAHALDLNPLSAIKGAVEAAIEDRSSEDIANDLSIKTKITAEVIDKMGSKVISINADVYEAQVMLSGAVESGEIKDKAARLTKGVAGVKRLYNEILVIKPIEKEKGAIEGFVDDTVIEGKINALLLDAQGIHVTNFRWRSVGGQVFLFGRALSRAELDKATQVVRGIKGVKSVTNRAFIRAK